MIKSILVLENGTEISAGATETNAIQNVSVEESCNDGEDLSFGSVCAKKITVNIITPKNQVQISAGEKITLYEEESEVRRKKGVFTSEKPRRKNSNSTKIEAYDNISLLDKDITDWFNALDAFPYTAFDMARLTFQHCGIGFSNTEIKNGDFKINEIKFASVTARQIIRWIGEICGCFCVADENGNATYRWYKENNTAITADGAEGSVIFLRGTLSYEDYEVKGVDGVQIQQGSEDLGISYPENLEGGNVYKISANPFLMVSEESAIKTIAQSLYDAVKNQIYTPCRVRVPASFKFDVGDIVRIEDANGVIIKSYIMRRNRNGNVENIECTGNYERNGATSLYNTDFSSQYGTILTIRKGLGELRIRAERADMAFAEYKIEVRDTYATQSMLTQYRNDTSNALSEYKQVVSNTYATLDMLTKYQNATSNSITKITQTADKDRSAIELLVEYDSNGNPKTSANLLIEAINGESTVSINSDKIDINGVVTANQTFKILEDGSMEATGGEIGGWIIGQYEIHSRFGTYGTYSFSRTGADYNTVVGHAFTCLTFDGITYVIKERNDYSSQTIIELRRLIRVDGNDVIWEPI